MRGIFLVWGCALALVLTTFSPPAFAADPWERAIRRFQGTPALPQRFPATVAGFQSYLAASGVRRLSAAALTKPNHPEVALRLGYRQFLPPQAWWPRGAALALLAERLAEVTKGPVQVRNWWRPAKYNRRVEGASESDHLTAHSVDLDYASAEDRRRAEEWLRQLRREAPWLRLSLGLGGQTTHVGIASPHGSREWRYSSYGE